MNVASLEHLLSDIVCQVAALLSDSRGSRTLGRQLLHWLAKHDRIRGEDGRVDKLRGIQDCFRSCFRRAWRHRNLSLVHSAREECTVLGLADAATCALIHLI